MSAPQTLFDIAGIQARIHILPGRPAFIMASDLAEVYGTPAKRLAEAVKRNPSRFPERFCFRLNNAETALLKSQSATSMKVNREFPMAFTHAGAYALAGVLTSDVAIEVGIAIFDAFAEMEARALADARFMLVKLRTEAMRGKSLRVRVIEGIRAGYSFEELWQMGRASRPRLEQAIRECHALGLIDSFPPGMPMRQADLFGEG